MNPAESLSVTLQCQLLDIPRSSYYYMPAPVSDDDLALMQLIDRCHLELPFSGSRRIKDWLFYEHGLVVNRKRIQRLMALMGIEALYPKPNTSQHNQQHKVYPYLLKGLTIDHANQVWAADITYIPMSRGFVYPVAVMDWYSRKVLNWCLSTTLDTEFCKDALEAAIERYGCPEIFNTYQGCQFTSEEFTGVLKEHEIRVSMDGKGRRLDNVFVERLWESVKYEEVYLKAYPTTQEARHSLAAYFSRYNSKRRHQGLGRQTPDTIYFKPADKMAA